MFSIDPTRTDSKPVDSIRRLDAGDGGWQVVCELDKCPGGLESVLVGDEAAAQSSRRVLLLRPVPTARHGEPLAVRHRAVLDGDGALLRGRDQTRQPGGEDGVLGQSRRRRLADVEDVDFSVPAEGGTVGEDGEVTTGSQQAAAFVNSIADMVRAKGTAVACRRGEVSSSSLLLLLLLPLLRWLTVMVVLVVVYSWQSLSRPDRYCCRWKSCLLHLGDVFGAGVACVLPTTPEESVQGDIIPTTSGCRL